MVFKVGEDMQVYSITLDDNINFLVI